MKKDLQQIAAYAKRHGYQAEVIGDKVFAKNSNGSVWTNSMDTIKKVCGR